MCKCRISRQRLWRLLSSGMLHCVALLRTDVSDESSVSIVGMTRIGMPHDVISQKTVFFDFIGDFRFPSLACSKVTRLKTGIWNLLQTRLVPSTVTAHLCPTPAISLIPSALIMQAKRSSETSVVARATLRHIAEHNNLDGLSLVFRLNMLSWNPETEKNRPALAAGHYGTEEWSLLGCYAVRLL
jgi:hypothetical protein